MGSAAHPYHPENTPVDEKGWSIVALVAVALWLAPGWRWRIKVGLSAVAAAAVIVIAINPETLDILS